MAADFKSATATYYVTVALVFQLYKKALGCLTTTSSRLTTLSSSDWSSSTLQAKLFQRDLLYLPCGFVSIVRVIQREPLRRVIILSRITYWLGNPMRLHIVAGLGPDKLYKIIFLKNCQSSFDQLALF